MGPSTAPSQAAGCHQPPLPESQSAAEHQGSPSSLLLQERAAAVGCEQCQCMLGARRGSRTRRSRACGRVVSCQRNEWCARSISSHRLDLGMETQCVEDRVSMKKLQS
eukprot:958719-Rhodomonas_salina.1